MADVADSDDRTLIIQPVVRRHVQRRDSLFDDEDNDTTSAVRGPDTDITGASGDTHEHNSRTVEQTSVSKRDILAVLLLTAVNLLNYMDRYSVAGVLDDIQHYYDINDKLAGLLSTAFIISYMLLSPVFGYLGDRYRRTLIMACGISGWSAVTLASSFIPQQHFWLFVVLRAVVGVGEASYSTIAPTIIADLFAKTTRTKVLCVFYFAIPVGSGLGYIAGALMARACGEWQWALRLTPGLGLVCALLLYLLVKEPVRGMSDHGSNLRTTSWCADLTYLLKHKSFMLSSAGFTCVAFVTGALALWAPEYMIKSIKVQHAEANKTKISLIFGGITCAAGFIGVGLGSFSASKLRSVTSKADPFVCAFGLLSSAPFLFLSLFLSRYNTTATWILIFVGETLLCLNWAIVTDILLYVVIPTRRSTAEAVQILMSHLLGDAGSPLIVGAISDAVKNSFRHEDDVAEYSSMQIALYMTCFVCAIGGGFFLLTALFIERDRSRTEKLTQGISVSDHEYVNGAAVILGDASNVQSCVS
jgi:MFS family permease